jgi:hypothetical protein
MIFRQTLLLTILAIASMGAYAQTDQTSSEESSSVDRLLSFPGKYIDKVQQKLNGLDEQLDHKTEKYLRNIEKNEARVYKKLWKKDSIAAKELIGDVKQRYSSLRADATAQAKQLTRLSQVYSGKLDSLGTAFRFMDNSSLIPDDLKKKISSASASLGGLQTRLNQTDQIRKYLKQRKQLLSEQLEKFGLTRKLKQFNKQVYYYQQQLAEYKKMLNDPAGMGKKLLGLAAGVPAFQQFFAKHSQLGSLFNLSGSLNNSSALLAGLQTRASVMQDLQNRFGTGPSVQQALQQNMQSAQDQLSQLKNKINQHLPQGGSSDDEIPDFKPNNQKTKNFWQRLEYGTNLQSQRPNNLFPVTSDIGLSLGYKLNDKSVIGLGASYKMGLGQSIRNINITNQGAGLRSFADVKLKGSFWISGGYEMNYRNEFNRIEVLKHLNAWQQSGLIGMSKVVSMNSKFFKKTKLQLLWDFLSYQQTPRTQAIVFRVGYNIK